jgi:Flp pilus assembly protein TadD
VLYFGKRYDEAATAYRDLIREFDADYASAETREVLREARLRLSNLSVIKDDLPQAEEWLEQVLDEFPDDVGAMNDLGYLWADQNKNLVRAQRMIQQAVDADPDNVAYRDSLGWVLFRLGKFPEAIAELEKAAAGKKPDGIILDHLGDAYLKANRRDKAVEAWRKAADVFRGEKETEKVKAVETKIIEH